MKCSLERG